MVSNTSSATVDWRPYRATGVMLLVAFTLNGLTGNGLWAWYTAIGMGGFLVVVGLARQGTVLFPTRPMWFLGIAGAMHYIGGSFAGVHDGFGVNGAYHLFPWWDNVVHALGAGAVAIAAASLLSHRLSDAPWVWGLVAVAVASLAGVAVELYEFAQFVFLGTTDQGFYTNTLLDLYDNTLGASVAAAVFILTDRRASGRTSTVPASHPGPDPGP